MKCLSIICLLCLAHLSTAREVVSQEELKGAVHYFLSPFALEGFQDTSWGRGIHNTKLILITSQRDDLPKKYWWVDSIEEVMQASEALNDERKILIRTITKDAYAQHHFQMIRNLEARCKEQGYALYVSFGK